MTLDQGGVVASRARTDEMRDETRQGGKRGGPREEHRLPGIPAPRGAPAARGRGLRRLWRAAYGQSVHQCQVQRDTSHAPAARGRPACYCAILARFMGGMGMSGTSKTVPSCSGTTE